MFLMDRIHFNLELYREGEREVKRKKRYIYTERREERKKKGKKEKEERRKEIQTQSVELDFPNTQC